MIKISEFWRSFGSMVMWFGLAVLFIMYVSPHVFVFWVFYCLRFVMLGLAFFYLWKAYCSLRSVFV